MDLSTDGSIGSGLGVELHAMLEEGSTQTNKQTHRNKHTIIMPEYFHKSSSNQYGTLLHHVVQTTTACGCGGYSAKSSCLLHVLS